MTDPSLSSHGLAKPAGMAVLTLALLFTTNAFNIADRILFAVLQEPIKHELQMSDFELGLLSGPGFALLYILCAVPLAQLADRANRVHLLSGVTFLWSAMTVLSGYATGFASMLATRAGLSIGQAGCVPTGNALIASTFPTGSRARAIAIFTAAGPVGALAAGAIGGWLAEDYGWRFTFKVWGFSGIVLAVLLLLLLPKKQEKYTTKSERKPIFRSVKSLIAHRSYRHILLGAGLANCGLYAIVQYLGSFLVRVHEMSLSSAGLIVGTIFGALGFISSIGAGVITDKLRGHYPRSPMLLPAICLGITALSFAIGFMVRDTTVAVGAFLMGGILFNAYMTSSYTGAQDLAQSEQRATAASLLVVVTGIGSTISPPVIGFMSDYLTGLEISAAGLDVGTCTMQMANLQCRSFGVSGLRWALLATTVPLLWASLHFWRASRYFADDIAGHRVSLQESE